MSAEVVKKRGRPKKVVLEPMEAEMSETAKKAATRSKSTATAPKPAISRTTAAKPSQVAKPTAKATSTSVSPQKTPPKPQTQQTSTAAQTSSTLAAKSTPRTPRTPVTPETSKILNAVREISTKNTIPPGDSTIPSKPPPTNSKPEPNPPKTATPPPPKTTASATISPTIQAKAPNPTPKKTPAVPPKISSPAPTAKPTPRIPIASLNSQVVDNISTRAGARPNTAGSKNTLPPGYKSVARKVTVAIVAMPIVIVTSWVLYQRLILGEDRKLLVKPGLTMVEESRDGGKSGEPTIS